MVVTVQPVGCNKSWLLVVRVHDYRRVDRDGTFHTTWKYHGVRKFYLRSWHH